MIKLKDNWVITSNAHDKRLWITCSICSKEIAALDYRCNCQYPNKLDRETVVKFNFIVPHDPYSTPENK